MGGGLEFVSRGCRKRPFGVEILFVSGDPVGGDVMLGGRQVETSLTNHLVKMLFESVFDVGVPGGQRVGFGPEIVDVLGSSQARSNEEIDLIVFGAGAGDAVFVKYLQTQ